MPIFFKGGNLHYQKIPDEISSIRSRNGVAIRSAHVKEDLRQMMVDCGICTYDQMAAGREKSEGLTKLQDKWLARFLGIATEFAKLSVAGAFGAAAFGQYSVEFGRLLKDKGRSFDDAKGLLRLPLGDERKPRNYKTRGFSRQSSLIFKCMPNELVVSPWFGFLEAPNQRAEREASWVGAINDGLSDDAVTACICVSDNVVIELNGCSPRQTQLSRTVSPGDIVGNVSPKAEFMARHLHPRLADSSEQYVEMSIVVPFGKRDPRLWFPDHQFEELA